MFGCLETGNELSCIVIDTLFFFNHGAKRDFFLHYVSNSFPRTKTGSFFDLSLVWGFLICDFGNLVGALRIEFEHCFHGDGFTFWECASYEVLGIRGKCYWVCLGFLRIRFLINKIVFQLGNETNREIK